MRSAIMRWIPAVVMAGGVMAGAAAAEWHAAANGGADKAGDAANPWSLEHAISAKSPAKPGDTIWVHAGSYGRVSCFLRGADKNPIRVRCWKDERVTLVQLDINYFTKSDACYTWFEGMEVTNRTPQSGPQMCVVMSNSDKNCGFNTGMKVINMVLHDGRMGVQFEGHGIDDEVNGCIIYYNGYEESDRGHGHGIYVQSIKGPKMVKDNIVFRNFWAGSQLYGSGNCGGLDNVTYEGNTFFNNGEISTHGFAQNMCVGSWAGVHPKGAKVIANMCYAPPKGERLLNSISKCDSPVIKDNYFAGPGLAMSDVGQANTGEMAMSGNTLIGQVGDPFKNIAGNTYLTARPTATKVFVRKNAYEEGRANITVFNWEKTDKVDVDASSAGLKQGDGYEVRDAQNWFAKPVAAGAYDGKTIAIPMTGLTVAAPIGLPAQYKTPPHTAPEFGAFVIRKTAAK
jgi:hypothetical protein